MCESIEQNKGHAVDWDAIEWDGPKRHVRRLQERIFRATRDKDWARVKNLQKLLVRSHSARLLSVKRVTQENKGKYTPGIDGQIYVTSEERVKLAEEVRQTNIFNYKCKPLRRVYIPKSSGDKRPLGIPTVKDRVVQMLVKLALEPEWEVRFESHSYGFRPGRRCMDAIWQIWNSIRSRKTGNTSEWILDADISGCFDNINHDALLKKIPVFRETVKRWLKSGIIEFGKYSQTKAGTPQGGIISPLLANIALDGLERLFGAENSKGNYTTPSKRKGENYKLNLIRYADDFIVTAPSRERIINYILPKLRAFLKERGMELNKAKTRVVHRDDGFDFLGFTIRQFHSQARSVCLAKPSKKAIKRHLQDIKTVISNNKQIKADELISKLNPIIRGWANYYVYSSAKETFNYIDYRIWKMLWQWCLRRHPRKGKQWIRKRYFMNIDNRKWNFGERKENMLLFSRSFRAGKRYTPVKGFNSPYDADLHVYWNGRHGRTWREKTPM
ncbi:MAG: group II intron reverse transcriptase/maturase [Promethearchaeota archaeon]|nr:MAG: group II intron reverse transcriptase/maturase [Candidatus Lokiarchaeota archaeon]